MKGASFLITLSELNQMTPQEFTVALGYIYEESPWVAIAADHYRPFSSLSELNDVMKKIVENAEHEKKKLLLNSHPRLGERKPMSNDSVKEQKNAGLSSLNDEEYKLFLRLNQAYDQKFGFPFILAVKGKTKEEIQQAIESRLQSDHEQEFETALQEVFKIAFFRLQEKIANDGTEIDDKKAAKM
jgi:OHCU decarboxylase